MGQGGPKVDRLGVDASALAGAYSGMVEPLVRGLDQSISASQAIRSECDTGRPDVQYGWAFYFMRCPLCLLDACIVTVLSF